MNNVAKISGIIKTAPTICRNEGGDYAIFDMQTRDSTARTAIYCIIANGERLALLEAFSRVGCGSRVTLVGEPAGQKGKNFLRILIPGGIVAAKERKDETA